ncbi:MAG: formate dehydrogenase accessory protein FdhE [Anaerolineae bacterium]
MSEHDRKILRALAKAREERKELSELLDFYLELYEVQFQAKSGLSNPEVRGKMAMRWRLEGGVPQLTFDQLGLDPDAFGHLVSRVRQVLLHHNPSWKLESVDWGPRELAAMAQEVFETWHTLTGPGSDQQLEVGQTSWAGHPVALAVGFSLAPYLQLASELILPDLDLSLWMRGYCPVCGGRPNFAVFERERGARQLMCSRCNSLWPYGRLGCPYCGSDEKQVYHASEDGVYRLYTCPECKRYLKTMDLRDKYGEAFPVLERLLTVGMDLAAQQEGYGN